MPRLRSLAMRRKAWLVLGALASFACKEEADRFGPGEGIDIKSLAPQGALAAPASPPSPPPQTVSPKQLGQLARLAPTLAPTAGGKIDLSHYEKKLVFEDHFDRTEFGADWYFHGGEWSISKGAVHSPFARNRCLHLAKPLPRDSVVEVTAWSEQPPGGAQFRGDVKFSLYGMGREGSEHEYTNGYMLILGGWMNALSVIARIDEHGKNRLEKPDPGVVKPGVRMRFETRRLGNLLEFWLDGRLHMTYNDPQPLEGPGHDRLAFCNWESHVYYDDLRIYALAPKAQKREVPQATKGGSK